MQTETMTVKDLDRRTGLGASDVAAACGLDPYRSPLDLWLEKRGLAEPFGGNEHTRWGTRIEPVLREALAEDVGLRPADLDEVTRWFSPDRLADVRVEQRQVTVYHPTTPILWATPDEVYMHGTEPVAGGEVKNKSVRVAHQWGETGTDEIPDAVQVQCHIGMACLGLEAWHVGAYFGGADFRTYHLTTDPQIAGELIRQAEAFWTEYVVPEKMPPVTSGDDRMQKTLARLFDAHSEAIDAATEDEASLIAHLVSARSAYDDAESAKKLLEAQIKAAIGDRAGIQSAQAKVTWKLQKGRTVTDYEAVVTTLAAQYPDDVQRAVEAATRTGVGFRVLRVAKAGAR